jgi:DNA-binding NarL/FixJ family response regulator
MDADASRKNGRATRRVGEVRGRTLHVDLTRREIEILKRVVCGDSNAEIARRLRVSEQTIKNRLSVLMQKFQVLNRVQLAVLIACEWRDLLH